MTTKSVIPNPSANYNEQPNLKASGHVRIWESQTKKVLLDTHNAIHFENFSVATAQSLSGSSEGFIHSLAFGNGGARATSTNKFIYSTPQTLGRSATLYDQTYFKVVNNATDLENYTKATHVAGNLYSDILVHCTLGLNEPNNQEITNVNTGNGDITTGYTFSEIGLLTSGNFLLTHLCFYPILKASNISLEIDYLIRIQVV